MSLKLYTLGNLTIDDIVIYDTQQMFLGRSGGNVLFAAIGARIWHAAVGMIARVGKSYPVENIDQIEQAGIETHLHRVPHEDIHDWALYEPGGGRQFINHLSSGSHYEMSITGEEVPPECLRAGAYHIAPMPTDVQASLVDHLAGRGALLSLDPHNQYLEQADLNRMAYALLPRLNVFLPSREEATAMFGRDDPEAAAKAFAAAGVPVVSIKLGAEGSLLYLAATRQMFYVPISPVNAEDPTGAGDAFCGGFLAGYLLNDDPLLAACCGTVSASFVVQHVGALATLDADLTLAQQRLEDVRSRTTEWN